MSEQISVYLSKAQKYCADSEQCEYTVRKKLKDWGVDTEEADYVVGQLVVDRWISEERYAASFARGKFRMLKWGRRKIEYQLQMYKISKPNIKIGLSEIDSDEYAEVLNYLAARKWDECRGEKMFSRKQKVYAYLVAKGYEYDLVQDAVEQLAQTEREAR